MNIRDKISRTFRLAAIASVAATTAACEKTNSQTKAAEKAAAYSDTTNSVMTFTESDSSTITVHQYTGIVRQDMASGGGIMVNFPREQFCTFTPAQSKANVAECMSISKVVSPVHMRHINRLQGYLKIASVFRTKPKTP